MDRFTHTTADDFTRKPFDFIVVGGGTAGLAVAARLAQHENKFTVGVLEAGGTAAGDDLVDIPAFYGRALGGQHDWCLETAPQPGLGGRTLPWPRGRVLGGTSALNFMTWVRASRQDYDAWEALGNAGWGWDDLLPFFKKSETFHPPSEDLKQTHDVRHDPSVFGTEGPIQICYNEEYSASHAVWHRTLNAVGVATNPAHHAGSNVGAWTNINTVDPKRAARSYSTNYLSLLDGGADNLHILTGAAVQNVVFGKDGDSTVATGVRFSWQNKTYEAKASREVVVCGGAAKSPQILEMSGIGKPEVLQAADVPVLVESPTVGENLQDHIMLAVIFEVDPAHANPDDLKIDKDVAAAAQEQYNASKTGPLTILPCSICYVPFKQFMPEATLASLRARANQASAFEQDKTKILRDRLDGNADLGQVEFIFDFGNWHPDFASETGKKYGTMLQILQYPFSVGSVHISPKKTGASSEEAPTDPKTESVIDPGYYAGDHGQLDVDVMVESAGMLSKIVQTEPLASLIRGPAFPAAGVIEDKDRMKDWIIKHTIVDWHPVGTCAMGGRGGIQSGVVDERLRVHGVKGLRVADASIMPLQISAHLQATVYAIAEKAAHMILEDNV